MNLLGGFIVAFGLIIFLIGYWFLALSNGQKECGDSAIVSKSSTNMGGGIAGIVIGIVIMIIGIFMGHAPAQQMEAPSE